MIREQIGAISKNYLLGALMVLLAAIMLSSKAVIVKLTYQYEQVDSISILTLRMVFSLPVYLLLGWLESRKADRFKLSRKDWLLLILMAFCGYYLASFLDFLGLQFITASLERLILFVYPTLVVVLSAIFLKKRIHRLQIFALVLTYTGILLAFAENLTVQTETRLFFIGAILVFFSALSYSIYLIGSGQLIPKIGSIRYTTLLMSFSAAFVLTNYLAVNTLEIFTFQQEVYSLALVMALFATVIPSFMISEGIRRIGSGNAAIIGSIGPVSTIILANIFLEETITLIQLVATGIVLLGVLLITVTGR